MFKQERIVHRPQAGKNRPQTTVLSIQNYDQLNIKSYEFSG